MADKTTTLKTKTNDNVYPNVIGDNRKNAFVDSSTITHHFYDKTHKVGFQINNETNIKIQNSLQKPSGLTKTKLVGVGTNGQENIEIGDNLTLANGKLSANGGGSGGGFKFLTTLDLETYTPDISSTDTNLYSYLILGSDPTNAINWFPLYKSGDQLAFSLLNIFPSDSSGETITIFGGIYKLSDGQITTEGGNYEIYTADAVYNNFQRKTYTHFITLTSNTSTFYFTYQNTSNEKIITLDSLNKALAGKYLLCTGHTDTEKAEYISGERGNIVVGVVDNSDNSTSGITIDSSYTISDDVSPVE